MTCHTSLDPGPQELPGQRAQEEPQSQGSSSPGRSLNPGQGGEQVPKLGDGAEQIGVWHLLGRRHVCEVAGGKAAPR